MASPQLKLLAALQRGWRGLLTRLKRPAARFVFHKRYDMELPGSTYDSRRARRILSFLISEGLLRRGDPHRPRAASMRALRRVHDDDYLESLQDPETLVSILGSEVPEEDLDRFLLAHRVLTGGTLLATRLAVAHGAVTVNLGGGFHHALAARGQGFCVFNDVAVAIRDRRAAGFDAPVLVIDLDLHDGDGTRAIFRDDDHVHTFSIHNRHLGPTEARASTSVELGSGVEDERYLAAVREHLPDLLRSFRPGLVFYLAGCDPAHDDALGDWRISADALLRRDRLVLRSVRSAVGKIPFVVLTAGGYGQEAWRYSARFFARLLGHRRVEPPPTPHLELARYRRISRMFRPSELTAEPADPGWSLSEEDLLPGSNSHHRTTRLLDYYSKHGIELALERYGVLGRLRAKGFDDLRVEWELNDPVGQMLRIRTGGPNPESLAEVRLRRDRRLCPGWELLVIEWLLLQDPQSRFHTARQRLPGQKHPGLGMLREVSVLLMLVCERLGLDGLAFVPAHYHIAALSGQFRFLDPEIEASFQALRGALRGTRLLEAVRIIERGGVVHADSGEPYQWEPTPMVLPVSDGLKQFFASSGYEERVRQAARAVSYRVL